MHNMYTLCLTKQTFITFSNNFNKYWPMLITFNLHNV